MDQPKRTPPGAEPDASVFKRFNRTAQHLILRRDDALAGDFPAAQHVARQASPIREVVACEASQGTASTKQTLGLAWEQWR